MAECTDSTGRAESSGLCEQREAGAGSESGRKPYQDLLDYAESVTEYVRASGGIYKLLKAERFERGTQVELKCVHQPPRDFCPSCGVYPAEDSYATGIDFGDEGDGSESVSAVVADGEAEPAAKFHVWSLTEEQYRRQFGQGYRAGVDGVGRVLQGGEDLDG